MKRIVLVLPILLFLSGCAQVFDGNLFKAVDTPPPLNAATLASSSTADIKKMSEDPTFYTRLKNDAAALAAVQKALDTNLANATTNQDKMDAATTLITVTANSSSVADIKTTLVNNLSSVTNAVQSGSYATVFKLFLGDQTEPQIEATLNTFKLLANTLLKMQTVATKPTDFTVDTTIFFLGASDPTSFAETALMASIAQALVTDDGGIVATATELAKASPNLPSGTDMAAFTAAKNGTLPVTAVAGVGACGAAPNKFCYAYMSAVNSKLSL